MNLTASNHLSLCKQFTTFLFSAAAILSACSEDKSGSAPTNSPPDPTRFTYEVVAEGLEEPMQIEFDQQGRVYWIERTGAVKMADENSGQVTSLGTVPLATERAPGLIGFALDQNFELSNQLYLYYSAKEDKGEFMRLSRFTLAAGGRLEMNSELVLLKIFWEQPDGEHFGGGMCWDRAGNLYLSIGCDSAPTQYAPFAFTNEGGRGQDSGRTAGNTNDLRGTIIRIRPEADGTYTIPEGNLFSEGTENTRPEIYVMGNRNPWRLSVDSETGYLHWGEVGPDAGVDSEKQGPMGYDEFNVAKEAGNFGWPYIIGKNLPYKSYNYETGEYGAPFDPEAPVNTSPNNTGLRELPPAKPAMVAYPYRVSAEWPILRSAARSAVGGPVFRKADFSRTSGGVFPDYYEGKWLVTDYVRNWIMVIGMNKERTEATSIEPFLPAEQLMHKQPLDLDFGPDGGLYIVEYGLAGQGQISKIVYNAGNRPPIAIASADRTAGSVPLELRLSADESLDHDGDQLSYNWTVVPQGAGQTLSFQEANPTATITQAGRYEVTLTVKDPSGASHYTSFDVIAGNEKPEIQLEITAGNSTFFFPNEKISYAVKLDDAEDGSLSGGTINPEKVSVTAEYVPSGLTPQALAQLESDGSMEAGTPLRHLNAQALIKQYNCMTCHKLNEPLLGPAYTEVAKRYSNDPQVFEKLHRSITEGSSGKWGESIMPPHTMLTAAETGPIVDYILSLANADAGVRQLAVQGSFQLQASQPKGYVSRLGKFYSFEVEPGSWVFHASYQDEGNAESGNLSLIDNDLVLLRYPVLSPESADFFSSEGISFTPSTDDPGFIFTGTGGYLGYKGIDLTDVATIRVGAVTRFWHWSHFIGGTVELRLDSPDGPLVGEPFPIIPPPVKEGDGPFFGEAAGKPIPFDVSAISRRHDIYILIKNEKASESDALVIMTGIEFLQ